MILFLKRSSNKIIIFLITILFLFTLSACNRNNKNTITFRGMEVSIKNDFNSDNHYHEIFYQRKNNEFNTNLINSINSDIDLYCNLNQDIYFNIKLNNPNKYDINIIKLNNLNYDKTSFESNSNSNNIIIKINTKEVPGKFEFKITEINYFSNKDRLLEIKQNNSIKIGINYLMPTLKVQKLDVFATQIILETNIIDDYQIGVFKVLVADENSVIKTIELPQFLSTNKIIDLKPNSTFQVKIIVECDLLDGAGIQSLILYQKIINTNDFDFVNIYNTNKNNLLLPNQENSLTIEFDNPNNYNIEEITVSNNNFSKNDFEIIDTKHLKISLTPKNSSFGKLEKLIINQVKYSKNDETIYTCEIDREIDFWTMKSITVKEISSQEDLSNIESGYSYVLINDIEIIGNWNRPSFKGIIDGKGHKIKGYVSENFSSLFGSYSGELKNIEFVDCKLISQGGFSTYTSVIIDFTEDNTQISNCIFNININLNLSSTDSFYFGGLVAVNKGTLEITDCIYEGNIDICFPALEPFSSFVGGYVGQSEGLLSFKNVTYKGNINFQSIVVHYTSIGALVGNGKADLKGCNVEADISVSNSSSLELGGMCGKNYGGTAEDCIMKGTITVTNNSRGSYVSGIGNFLDYVSNCLSEADISITSTTYVITGGLAVSGQMIRVDDSKMSGNIKVNANRTDVGGIVASYQGIISNCSMEGNIDVQTEDNFAFVGGINGVSSTFIYPDEALNIKSLNQIDNCKMNGNISVISKNRIFVGGIISVGNGVLTNNTVNGDIDIKSDSYVFIGGIIGFGKIFPLFENCSYTGKINVKSEFIAYVGGILGYIDESTAIDMVVNNVYAKGDFTVETNLRTYTGGLFGYMDRRTMFNLLLNNSEYEGNINVKTAHNSFVGGLIAHSGTSMAIENCRVSGSLKADSGASAYLGGFIASGYLNVKKSLMLSDIEANSKDTAYIGGFLGYNKYNSEVKIVDCLMAGNLSLNCLNNIYLSPFLGFNYIGGKVTIENSYISENGVLKINNIVEPVTVIVATCEQLNSEDFYINNLKFDETIWDFTILDSENKIFPILK